MRVPRLGALLALVLPLGCSSTTTTTPTVDSGAVDTGTADVPTGDTATGDAPPGDTPDAGNACDGEPDPMVSFRPGVFFLNPGATGAVTVLLAHDRCAPATLPVSVTGAAATVAVSSVNVAAGGSTATVNVTAVSAGTATLHVGNGTLTVTVLPPGVPACPSTTPSVTGHLAPGGRVTGTAGSPLAQASVAVPMAAAVNPPTVAGLDVTLGCAADQVPTGFTAVGPAVTFGPAGTLLPREVPITLPVNGGMVPVGYELQVEIAYTGPAFPSPRVVPVADLHLADDGQSLLFSAPRLGTYQAVIRTGLGTRHYTRHFTWHAILGVSMGAAGASMIGTRHMDMFDFIAPLGGPVDWNYLGHYIETFHMGGFCNAAQRLMDPMGCAMGALTSRNPTDTELFEHPQDFEHWYYPDGDSGQGGTFDRQSYTQIFRDLTRMFGNAVMNPGPTGVLPAGIPDGELTRTDADRCTHPVVIPTGYYDDEYNPDGTLPVVTFCDGTHIPGHVGVWDGTAGDFPLEVGLAVDVNHNGRRDYGEPVIRDFHEPWRDYGADGVPSAMEPGYNPVTNPDPAHDDYDRQYNPGGTEGNFAYEMGEPFDDVGVDGVRCPVASCPYDLGEGNHRFDMTPGSQRFRDVNPRTLLAGMTDDVLHRVELWTDGGVRDLFNFGCDADHLVGALAQRNRPVHYYNNFAPLGANRVAEDPFPYSNLDWARVPGNVMVRYGTVDANAAQLLDGDGGHVGTITQITNRLFSSLWWIQARWPQGDRTVQMFSSDTDNAGHCANGYFCTFDFHSDHANRTGPVSIYLPPGYHDPANASVTYPVVFFLHGYGQQPMDLSASGLVVGNFMASGSIATWQRPQKYIMVFPDGRCRDGDGCLRGTFYTDSPVHNVQMETYFLDLYHFIDTTYRVRAPADIDVTE